jgi:nucleotide-binding universal stress UspA family protein
MAARLRSYTTGIAYALVPPQSFTLYPEFTAEIIERYREEGRQVAEKAGERFASAAKQAEVPHRFQVSDGTVEQATADFSRRLRTADIAILGQHEPGLDHVGDLFAEAALFRSGRPMIVVPKNHNDGFSANRILVAWDGSQHAARAVAAAMPLLEGASDVSVFTVRESQKGSNLNGADLVRHLRLHGCNADLAERSEPDVASAVAAQAQATRASLVVMGAYGHSRLRELVFGGVTRRMLTDVPVPVLMAH